MQAPENTETLGLRRCQACDAEQPRPDKFCRRCGDNQRLGIAPFTKDKDWAADDTRPLLAPKHYDSFSGALVTLVTEGMSAHASSLSSSFPGNRRMMVLASALAAVPLWLMIMLLSPLDVYAAARAIVKRA